MYHSQRQEPTISSLISQLKHCGKQRDLPRGKHLHIHLTQLGWQSNVYVASTLISMYCKCGDTQQARHVFDQMTTKTVVSWTALITGYVENQMFLESLDIFHQMDCPPNAFTFAAALKACSCLVTLDKNTSLMKGLYLHGEARKLGFEKDIVVASTLVDMYSKLDQMQRAKEVFDIMSQKDVVTWNVLILGYMENGQFVTVLETFYTMDCAPNGITISSVLKACASLASRGRLDKDSLLRKGIFIHDHAKVAGLDKEIVVSSALVDMYCKCGDMQRAREVFDDMKLRNVVVWTCLIDGYVGNGECLKALELFESMECGKNHVTFVAALKACVALASGNELDRESSLRKGVSVHLQAKKLKVDFELPVANLLLAMYIRFGETAQARRMFDHMKHRDVISWTTLIQGYATKGDLSLALETFHRMDCLPDRVTLIAAVKSCIDLAASNHLENETCLRKGTGIHKVARELGLDSEVTVGSALIEMYSQFGYMDMAQNIFDKMPRRETVTWTVLISGYVENGESSIALEMFRRMDCEADRVTFVSALKACSSLVSLETGVMIHEMVCKSGCEQDVVNSLVDFYGKCGRMESADYVFDQMYSPDVVSFNALIGGYSSVGCSTRVFELVGRMQESGVQPNDVTVQLVLSMCSHSGLVEAGKRFFESMPKLGVGLTEKHCACMVDMLGRAGRMDEALDIVRGMGERANSVVWMSLLDACRQWGNAEVAFKALSRV